MSLPKISIIIPSYNYGEYLEKAIKSVIDQKYPNLELIILDGGSQDNTVDIIKKYESQISFWRSHKDAGSYVAANEGLEKATGDIIGFLCADDWYEDNIFNDIGKAFESDKELDVVSFHTRYLSEKELKSERVETSKMELDFYGDSALNARFYHKRVFKYYGKILWEGVVDGKYFLSGDWEFMLRLSILPIKHKLINKVGYTYRIHDKSMSFGEKAYIHYKKLLEEQVIISTRYLDKKDIFSKQIINHLSNIYKKATVKLYLIESDKGNKELAEHYRKMGEARGKFRWNYSRLVTIKRGQYAEIIKKINE